MGILNKLFRKNKYAYVNSRKMYSDAKPSWDPLIIGHPGTGKGPVYFTPSEIKNFDCKERSWVKEVLCKAIDNIPDCAGIADCYTEHSYMADTAYIKVVVRVKESTGETIHKFHGVAHNAFDSGMGFIS